MTIKVLLLLLLLGYLVWTLYMHINRDSKKIKGMPKLRMVSIKGEVFDVRLKPAKIDKKKDITDDSFLVFSRILFQKVCDAFAAGKKDELKPLLTPKAFAAFVRAIEGRKVQKQDLEFSLIGINSAKIVKKTEHYETVTVEFTSEQVNVLKDEKANPIEGDPMHVARMLDIWTFQKKGDFNWIVSSTKSEPCYA